MKIQIILLVITIRVAFMEQTGLYEDSKILSLSFLDAALMWPVVKPLNRFIGLPRLLEFYLPTLPPQVEDEQVEGKTELKRKSWLPLLREAKNTKPRVRFNWG